MPCYMINEWILLDNGLGLIPADSFIDTGGSIVIHAFGTIFGLGIITTMTTPEEFNLEDGISKGTPLAGIGLTILVASITGFAAGKLISVLGRKTRPYVDLEEFEI